MALESMASLSDLLSSLLSSKPPSPSILKPMTLPTSVPARSSLQHLSMTTKILTAGNDDVTNRVAYPSLANANLVFFKSGYYNVEVVPKEGESEEQLVNDFKRSCFRAGVLQESRRRRFFESSQEKKKRKTKEAAKKYRKRSDSFFTFVFFSNTLEEVDHNQLQKPTRAGMFPEKTKKTITGNFLLTILRFHILTGLRSKPESYSGTVM
ncbi:hypothetical protein CARUB_v10027766mg [Capsella rubella]|uniref:30S ribosomal protein S21, chloroplastic n=1 Tax=Capsella rubella TaxID=81985 RepID=R0GCZ6_9BRAS|nr:hypothetical protein CARUB_v10027766mg [Capsella rubella]